jgi:hypothetical protein
VELSGAPLFDEAARGDAAASRAYRSLLADERATAAVWLETDSGPFAAEEVDVADPCRPAWRGRAGDLRVSVVANADAGGVVLRWRMTAGTRRGAPLGDVASQRRTSARLRVRCRLDRPALAEITELQPPPSTGAVTRLRPAGRRLVVTAEALPAEAELAADVGSWRLDGENGAVLDVGWPQDATEPELSLRCRIRPGGRGRAAAWRAGRPACPVELPRNRFDGQLSVPDDLEPDVRALAGRAVAYVRGCAALAVASDERAMLADHRLLPLSWTRDAYWQAALLLATGDAGDVERVADHLRWLWRRCERPDGRWVRSHHADGRRKDLAFQADQQLYPMLELADWWRITGRLPSGVAWTDAVPGAWRAALNAVDPLTGLIWSMENPADDPAGAPFIASTQILLWYVASRLAELAERESIGLVSDALLAVAERSRYAFGRHLVADGRWAYATDAAGRRVACHDANDLPTALAPLLGFCSVEDATWRATMAFAFSPANPWCVPGQDGGLGSAHTPGPWTLGHVQAWMASSLRGDAAAARAALERLIAAAFADGMLPEVAAGRGRGAEPIRHWFAWPGAALGALALLSGRALLQARLGVPSAHRSRRPRRGSPRRTRTPR